uniref:histone acetyltransferase n=1 Tax=Bursaphelenchus xylophilus TaxID=6326 RepID=A0A1I7S5B2_BURXY
MADARRIGGGHNSSADKTWSNTTFMAWLEHPAGFPTLPSSDPKPSTSTKIPMELSIDHSQIPSSSSPSPNSTGSVKKREKRLSEASQQNSDASKTELKSLQDSLSSYFTPSNSRRSRVAQSSFSLENFQTMDDDKLGPLEIDVDKAGSAKNDDDSNVSSPSPQRQTDRLFDSLSPYFSANTERRRKHEKGEYKQLCNGIPLKKKGKSEDGIVKDVLHDVKNDEEREPRHHQTPSVSSVCGSGENVEVARMSPPIKRKHTSFDSEDLVSPPSHSLTPSDCAGPIRSRQRRVANRASANLLKRARQHQARLANSQKLLNSASTSNSVPKHSSVNNVTSPRKNRNTAQPVSTKVVNSSTIKITSPLRRSGSFSPLKSVMEQSTSKENAYPINVPKEDEELFNRAQKMVQDRMDEHARVMAEKGEEAVYPSKIRIGRHEIEVLYSSPYPAEFAGVCPLYICEHCLMYMANDKRHKSKCTRRFPPGNEIYRKDNLSIFEVDGNTARVYCRNLCLLAKCFMEHKTLYYDVEPFLFYVCMLRDEYGLHFAGYFSKEKFSHQKFNLACIVTQPAYQNAGIGRFLIDFSYLLSRQESMLGTPERPLSELGRIAYESYWRTAIFEFLYKRKKRGPVETLSLMEISRGTGISNHDVVDTLKAQGFIGQNDGEIVWLFDFDRIEEHWIKAEKDPKRIWLDESRLRWTPRVYTPTIDLTTPTRIAQLENTPQQAENSPKKNRRVLNPKNDQRGRAARNSVPTDQEDQNHAAGEETSPPRPRKNRKNSKAAVLAPKNQLLQLSDEDVDPPPMSRRSSFVGQKPRPDLNGNRRPRPSTSTERSSDDDDFEPTAPHSDDEAASSNSDWSRTESMASSVSKPGRGKSFSKGMKNESKLVENENETIHGLSSDEEDILIPPPRRPSASGKKGKPAAGKKGGKGKKSKKAGSDSDEGDKTYVVGGRGNKKVGRKPGRPAPAKVERTKKGIGKRIDDVTFKPSATAPTSEASSRTTSPRPSTSTNIHHRLLVNESDDDDEANHSDMSASPGPLSSRTTRISLVAETMNMGGEPDTVNMGGEPDDEDENNQQFAATPKAPKPHMIEDEYSNHVEHNDDEAPPMLASASHHVESVPINHNISAESHGSRDLETLTSNNYHHEPNVPSTYPQPWIQHKNVNGYNHKTDFLPHKSSVPDYNIHKNEFAHRKSTVGDFTQLHSYDSTYHQTLSQPEIYQEQHMVSTLKPQLDCPASSHTKMPGIASMDPASAPPELDENEMPILKAEDNSDMPVLDEAEDDDAPPPLSPKFGAQANDAVDSGPPVLDNSSQPPRRSSGPPKIAEPKVTNAMEKLAIDCTPSTSMPQPLNKTTPELHFHGGSGDYPKLRQNSVHHQSPILPPNSNSPANYKPNSLPQPSQIFSPPAQIHTPNSHQPLSQTSTSTNSESVVNQPEMLSPPNLSKPTEPIVNFTLPPAAPPTYSPPKSKEKKTSVAATISSHQTNQARRRNTTDGSTHKPMTRPSTTVEPALPAQPAMNTSTIGGFPFMNPYLGANGISTTMAGGFPINYGNQMPATNRYDYNSTMLNTPNYFWNMNYPLNNATPANPMPNPAKSMPASAFPILNPAMPNPMDTTGMQYYNGLQPNTATPQMPPTNGASNFANFANAALAPNPSNSAYYY